jgi:enoyl-CoA hydratase
MSFENLLVESDGAVTTVTINRPAVLNALNVETLKELRQAVAEFEEAASQRVMLLTGGGSKAFVAGADISQMAGLGAKEGEAFARVGQELGIAMEACPKPIIAVVNGFALGGGCELAMACDFIVASDRARFGQPEVNLGLIPGFGGTQRLTRLVGRGMARRLVYSGEIIRADRALEIGLVTEVVEADSLMEQALGLAQTIASKGPLAVAACKDAILRGADCSLNDGLELEVKAFGSMFETEDMREGTQAFVEKRKAEFKGR